MLHNTGYLSGRGAGTYPHLEHRVSSSGSSRSMSLWAGTEASSQPRAIRGTPQRYAVISNAVQGDLPLPWYRDLPRPTHLDLQGVPKSHSQTTLGSPNLVSGWHFLRTAQASRRGDPVGCRQFLFGRQGGASPCSIRDPRPKTPRRRLRCFEVSVSDICLSAATTRVVGNIPCDLPPGSTTVSDHPQLTHISGAPY